MPVRPLIRFPGPVPRSGNVSPEMLAIYERYARYATCGSLVAFIERFLEVWVDWIENRQQELLDLIDGLLADLDDAQLGTEIKNFLGDLADPEWEDHWSSLDDGADLDEGADPADREGCCRRGRAPLRRHGRRHGRRSVRRRGHHRVRRRGFVASESTWCTPVRAPPEGTGRYQSDGIPRDARRRSISAPMILQSVAGWSNRHSSAPSRYVRARSSSSISAVECLEPARDDRFPVGNRIRVQDAGDVVERQSRVLEHLDEDQSPQRRRAVPALARLAPVGIEQAAAFVVADARGRHAGLARHVADGQVRVVHVAT